MLTLTQTFLALFIGEERLEGLQTLGPGRGVCVFRSLDVLVFVLGNPQPLILEGRLGGGGGRP